MKKIRCQWKKCFSCNYEFPVYKHDIINIDGDLCQCPCCRAINNLEWDRSYYE